MSEVDEEIRFHLERRVEDLVAGGLVVAEAERLAVAEFGDVGGTRAELIRADLDIETGRRRVDWLEDLWIDVRFGLRSLRKTPGWATVTILTLAIGIGSATAVFAAFEGILLRPLPATDPDRIVVATTEHPERADAHFPLSWRDVRSFGERTSSLSGVAAIEYNRPGESILQVDDGVFGGRGARVSGDLFPVLGVVPVLGRTILPEDDVPGAEPVMVVGYELWRRELGLDPAVLGRRITWNGFVHTVIGVAPAGFEYPEGAEFWTAVIPAVPGVLESAPTPDRTTYFHLVGRLRDGQTPQSTHAELNSFLRETDPQRENLLRGARPVVTLLPELMLGDARAPVIAVYGAGLLVLLLTCINVAGLLLIRSVSRGRELALRRILGAGRGRIVRQLLTEAALLATAGGVIGCLLAWAILQGLLATAPPDFPRIDTVRLDRTSLLFAALATAAAALMAGLAPAVRASAGMRSLRLSGAAPALTPRTRFGRAAVVVLQAALAVIVLAGAGLLLRSVQNLNALEPGFDVDRLSLAQLQLPPEKTAARHTHLALIQAALDRLRNLPGVEGAALVAARPFSSTGGWDALVSGEGQDPAARATNPLLNFEVVSSDYFPTLGIPLLTGRGFSPADHAEALPVAVISESLAQRFWPGQDPIGRRIKIGEPDGPMPWHTVVGVAAETRYRELIEPRPTFYLPVDQFTGPVPMRLVIRTDRDVTATTVLPQVRAALHEVDPDLAIANVHSMTTLVESETAGTRFSARLLGFFATTATSLAAIGLFGMTGASVRQRRAELAVRRAVGARSQDIAALVLRRSFGVVAIGWLLGVAGVVVGGRLLAGMLFGVRPTDPVTLLAVLALLLVAAALACAAPALRAVRIHPAESLREG